jgi:glycosyltransferase involved in cell wall biosynthesis
MTDPLGQSQVIPYLSGLADKGHEIYLISCEKKSNASDEYKTIELLLKENKIKWFPLKYTAKPAVFSTIYDIIKIKRLARKIIKEHSIELIHCRSYIAALAGLAMKRKYDVKFIFDMRGFYADERVDGKLWNINNPLYSSIYKYFKKKEKQFILNADHIISLTENAKKIILGMRLTPKPLLIEVIPCCVDLNVFDKENIKAEEQNKWLEKLKIDKSDFILSYLGSLGTWYLPDEMLDFFKVVLKYKNNAKFLSITQDPPETFIKNAVAKGIPADRIIVQKATRNEVPVLVSLSHVSIFFIKPVFSKLASSPTKMGEIMGMGIPIICNANVGDVDEIIKNSKGGYLINSFNESDYESAVDAITGLLKIDSIEIRKSANKYFSLQSGIEKYNYIYKKLAN